MATYLWWRSERQTCLQKSELCAMLTEFETEIERLKSVAEVALQKRLQEVMSGVFCFLLPLFTYLLHKDGRPHLRSSSYRTLVVPWMCTSLETEVLLLQDRACETLCRLRYDRWPATDSLGDIWKHIYLYIQVLLWTTWPKSVEVEWPRPYALTISVSLKYVCVLWEITPFFSYAFMTKDDRKKAKKSTFCTFWKMWMTQ